MFFSCRWALMSFFVMWCLRNSSCWRLRFFPSQRAVFLPSPESDTVALPNWKYPSVLGRAKHVSKQYGNMSWNSPFGRGTPKKNMSPRGKISTTKGLARKGVLMNNHLVILDRTSTFSGQVVHVGGDASFTSRAERYAQQHRAGLLWYMCTSNGWQENVKPNCICRWDMVDMSAYIWMQNSDGFEVSLF